MTSVDFDPMSQYWDPPSILACHNRLIALRSGSSGMVGCPQPFSLKGLHSVPNYIPGLQIFPLLSSYPHVISKFELINVCNPETYWGE